MTAMRIDGRRGSLLIITLWLVVILSLLAVAIGRYLSLEVRLTRYRLAREQAKTLARDGVYLAMGLLDQDARQPGEGYDWLGDDWALFEPPAGSADDPTTWLMTLGSSPNASSNPQLAITIIDEERKLNIGSVPSDPNHVLFQALASLVDSHQMAARIMDYVDADAAPIEPGGLESDDAAEPPYVTKNAPVTVHEELLEVPDAGDAYTALRRHTSVADPGTKLNLNTAQPEVLRALGFSDSTIAALEQCRQQGTIFSDTAALVTTMEQCAGAAGMSTTEQGLIMNHFGVVSRTFTVRSSGIMQRPAVRATVEAVVQRSLDGTEPTNILAWREE